MCLSFASAAIWSRSNETLNIAHSVFAAWELSVCFSISWESLSSNFSHTLTCEDKPSYSLTTLFFFSLMVTSLLCHSFLLRSFLRSSDMKVQVEYRRETAAAEKGVFFCSQLPWCHPRMQPAAYICNSFRSSLWFENRIYLYFYLPSSLIEQHPTCANAMTNRLLWAVNWCQTLLTEHTAALMRKQFFFFLYLNSMRISPSQKLRAAYFSTPTYKVSPRGCREAETGLCDGDMHAILTLLHS